MSLERLASCPNLPPLLMLVLSLRCSSWSYLQPLAKLPCTVLHLVSANEKEVQDFARWSAGQRGRECLGRLTSLEWRLSSTTSSMPNPPWSHIPLSSLSAAAVNLRSLALEGPAAAINDMSLVIGLSQLTSLRVECAGPADADVVSPLAALPNLQQLTVAGLSVAHVDAVMRAATPSGQLRCLKKLIFMPRL